MLKRMPRRRSAWLRLLALVMLVRASPASAQPAAEPAPQPAAPPAPTSTQAARRDAEESARDRTLRGHIFLVPINQRSAFVNTYVGVRQEVSFQSIPRVPLVLSTVNLRLLGVDDNIDFGVKLLSWLGVFGNLHGLVKTGVNTDTLIARGGNYELGASGGVLVRLLRLESTGTQIAVSSSGGYSSGKSLNVYPLAVAIYNAIINLQLPTLANLERALLSNIGNYVLIPTDTSTFTLEAHAAQTFTRNFSFQFTIGGVRQLTIIRNYDLARNSWIRSRVSTWLFDGAFALTADGSPNGIPAAFMLEYAVIKGSRRSLDLGISAGTPAVKQISAGLYYTGRPSLQAGIGSSFLINQEPVTSPDGRKSASPSEIAMSFILRYIW